MKKMKHTGFSTIILLHLTTSLILFIPPTQSTLSHTGLLEQICRQSPHYHLCTITLRSSIQHRSKADIAGFARLTLEIVNANATTALEHIQKGYVQTRNREQKRALDYCLVSYNTIVNVYLHKALNAMDKGDYRVVKQEAYAAGIQGELCDNKFKNLGTFSPLRDTSLYVQNLCAITLSIVNKLLQPNHLASI